MMEHIRDIVTRKGVRGLYSGIIFEYYKVSELVYDMACVVVADFLSHALCTRKCVHVRVLLAIRTQYDDL